MKYMNFFTDFDGKILTLLPIIFFFWKKLYFKCKYGKIKGKIYIYFYKRILHLTFR